MRWIVRAALAAIGVAAPALAEAQTAMTDDPCAVLTERTKAMDAASAEALRKAQDWPALCRYSRDDAAIAARPDVVFIGDSLTEGWRKGDPAFFSDRIVNRGVSGQTSTQILARFYQDVVALHPRAVHIIAGSNDVAGNGGPTSMMNWQNNMRAMVDLARANGITVIIGSVLPADRLWWAPDARPADQLRRLNTWLRTFTAERRIPFIDYYTAMSTPQGAMRPGLSDDHVHPSAAGYAVMAPIARAALSRLD